MKNLARITDGKDVTTKEYVDGGIEAANRVVYGICSTAADDPDKEVILACRDLDNLGKGVLLSVYFTYGNTVSNPALFLSNETDDKPPEDIVLWKEASTGTTYLAGAGAWRNGEQVLFTMLPSGEWQIVGRQPALSDRYGVVELSDAVDSNSDADSAKRLFGGPARAATPKAVKTAYDLAASKQDPITGGNGVVITGGTNVGLTDKFYNYLVRETFEKPTIAAFAVTGLGGAAEIGTSVEVSGFTHYETNIDNFDGTLTLKKGNDVLAANIAPSNDSASGSFTSQTVASNAAATVTFTLSGTYTMPGANAQSESVSRSVSKTFYVPKIYGVSENSTVTPEELAGMTRVQSYPSPTTVQVLANGYIFLAVTGTITKVINADTGFGVAVTQLADMTLSINGVNKNYHVYRTDELTPQTLKMTITAS